MGPWDISDKRALPQITEWLKQSSPLYVDVDIPHSGGPGTGYLINDLSQLTHLLQCAAFTSAITIIKDFYLFRGCLDEQMQNAFHAEYKEGEYWWVLGEEHYPEDVPIVANGSQWSEIETGLKEEPELHKNVLIGKEPDFPDYTFENTDDKVLILIKSYKYNFREGSWINFEVSLYNFEGIDLDVPILFGMVTSKESAHQCIIKLWRPFVLKDKTLEILEVTSREKCFPIDNIIPIETEERRGINPVVSVNVIDVKSRIRFTAELRAVRSG